MLPRPWCPGSRFVLLAAPSHLQGSGVAAAIVRAYSCGAVPDFDRLPSSWETTPLGYSRDAEAVNRRGSSLSGGLASQAAAILPPVTADQEQTMHDLRAAGLFAHLDEGQVAKLASLSRPLHLPAEHTVFLQGDPASSFYLLAEGRVKVYKLLRDGRTATVRHVEPPQTFAEAAVFHDTYSSSAETMAPCRLYCFDTRVFRELLLAEPQLALNLLSAMAELLALLNRRVEELLLPVPARLARYLLALAEDQDPQSRRVSLPTSRRELAARLGTVPETLSRTFDRLKRGGILRAGDKRDEIELVDLERLRRLAQD